MAHYPVYENDKGESFHRTKDTYGHTEQYDIERKTKQELDDWLTRQGFRIVGYEKEETA